MAYSEDLREKVLEQYDICKNKSQVAMMFRIHRDTIRKWIDLREETGELKHRAGGVRSERVNKEELRKYIEEHPDQYLHEIAEEFNCSPAWICELIKKMKLTKKKRRHKSK